MSSHYITFDFYLDNMTKILYNLLDKFQGHRLSLRIITPYFFSVNQDFIIMSKRAIIIIIVVVLALFVISGGVLASDPVYINSASDIFDGLFSSLYAIGEAGTAQLTADQVWVLSADGLVRLGSETAEEKEDPFEEAENRTLLYDDGSIKLKSTVVKVGLRYYYSKSRDSSLYSANLENHVGSGYAFGYYDEDRVFNELARTDETKITMRITDGSGIGVYITGTDTLIYELEYTDADNMLAIHPLCEELDENGELVESGEAITWFKGNKYYGDFEYVYLGGDGITVINVVDIERYVMGVCASEMSESWPVEAIKAQAVAARTYVQKNMMVSSYYSICGFDVTNDTYCQAYSGCTKVGDNIEQAVLETANQYITYKGSFIDALYFSSDGGATEDNINVNGNRYHPYLTGVIDPYEQKTDGINPYSKWTVQFTPFNLASRVGLEDIDEIEVTNSATGNVIKLVFISSGGERAVLERSACRTALGLFSIRYSISVDEYTGNYVFEGSGWGHNLGMSQYGAYAMAGYYDKTYKDILGFYYTEVGLSYGSEE